VKLEPHRANKLNQPTLDETVDILDPCKLRPIEISWLTRQLVNSTQPADYRINLTFSQNPCPTQRSRMDAAGAQISEDQPPVKAKTCIVGGEKLIDLARKPASPKTHDYYSDSLVFYLSPSGPQETTPES
jgi:hypothetical protein